MTPGDLPSQRFGLFDREHRRVVNRVKVYAEILQPAEQSFRGRGGQAVYQKILFVIVDAVLPRLIRELPAVVIPHQTENTKISTPMAWTPWPMP